MRFPFAFGYITFNNIARNVKYNELHMISISMAQSHSQNKYKIGSHVIYKYNN